MRNDMIKQRYGELARAKCSTWKSTSGNGRRVLGLESYGGDNSLLGIRVKQEGILIEIGAEPCCLGLGVASKNGDCSVAFSQVLARIDIQRIGDKGRFAPVRIAFFSSNGRPKLNGLFPIEGNTQ